MAEFFSIFQLGIFSQQLGKKRYFLALGMGPYFGPKLSVKGTLKRQLAIHTIQDCYGVFCHDSRIISMSIRTFRESHLSLWLSAGFCLAWTENPQFFWLFTFLHTWAFLTCQITEIPVCASTECECYSNLCCSNLLSTCT